MHHFTIETHEEKKIMFCRKCGLSFRLIMTDHGAEWRYMPLNDAEGDELVAVETPTCIEFAEEN